MVKSRLNDAAETVADEPPEDDPADEVELLDELLDELHAASVSAAAEVATTTDHLRARVPPRAEGTPFG